MTGQSDERILLLAHVDTVYPLGAWNDLWSVKDDRAYGPGTYDMKAGFVQALWALRALKAQNQKPAWTIDLLLTSDEEVGSEAGLPFIENLARGAKAVLVLEAPFMNGDLKIARKGVGDYNIQVHGKAAHQGVEPEKGKNAIVSAAHLIDELIKLQDLEKGTTLGPNVIKGGTVSNVVADHVDLAVDLRIWSQDEAQRVDAALKAIRPLDGTRYEITGGLNRPPMEPSEGSYQLLEKAQRIASELGFQSWRGARRRRLGWKFHRQTCAHAGWLWRLWRKRTSKGFGIHSYSKPRASNRIAGWNVDGVSAGHLRYAILKPCPINVSFLLTNLKMRADILTLGGSSTY